MGDRPLLLIDLDGTLLDNWERLHVLFCTLAAPDRMDAAEFRRRKRSPMSNQSLLRVCFDWDEPRIDAFVPAWLARIEAEELLARDVLHPGAAAALDRLASRHALVLLTARQRPEGVAGQLARLGIAGAFARVLVTGPGGDKRAALAQAGLGPGTAAALVGDTAQDMAVARSLGMRAVAVANGARDPAYLRRTAPDELHETFAAFAAAWG